MSIYETGRLNEIAVQAIVSHMPTFGENVRRLRKAAGFKQAKQLAEALDVAGSVVSRWETDQSGLPEAPTLLKLSRVLKVTVNDLLEGVDQDHDRLAQQRQSEAVEKLHGGADLGEPGGVKRFNQALRLLDEARSQEETARAVRLVLGLRRNLPSLNLSADDLELLEAWHSISENARTHLRELIRSLPREKQKRHRQTA